MSISVFLSNNDFVLIQTHYFDYFYNRPEKYCYIVTVEALNYL